MYKPYLIIILSCMILVSCTSGAKKISAISGTGSKTASSVKHSNREIVQEKKINTLLELVNPEDKPLFANFQTALKSGDKSKIEKALAQLQKLEIAKRKEVTEMTKNGNIEKATALRKSMQIFYEIRSEDEDR